MSRSTDDLLYKTTLYTIDIIYSVIKSNRKVHHNLFITLLFGSKLISLLPIQTVLLRVKCKGYIGKGVLNSHLVSNPDLCCIQNHVIMNRVIKRFRCVCVHYHSIWATAWQNQQNDIPLDTQADLGLRWAYRPYCWFCHEAAHFILKSES